MNLREIPVYLPQRGVLLLSLLLCACSSDGKTADGGAPSDAADAQVAKVDAADPCAIPDYPDDIVLKSSEQKKLPTSADVAVSNKDALLVCGDGFVAALTGAPIAVSPLSDPRLAGACRGIAADDAGRVLVTTAGGDLLLLSYKSNTLAIVDVAVGAAPALFGAAIDGDTAWIAAGTSGLLRYSIKNDKLTKGAGLKSAKDARDVALFGTASKRNLLVADGYLPGSKADPTKGGGAEIRLIAADSDTVLAELKGLEGIAARIILGTKHVLVLRAGFGVDVVKVGDTTLERTFGFALKHGALFDALLQQDDLIVAAGSRLLRYRLEAKAARLVSTEDRKNRGQLSGPFFRGMGLVQKTVVTIAGDAVIPLTLGAGKAAPEIEVTEYTQSLTGGQKEALFKIFNIGDAPLIISGFSADAPFKAEAYADLAPPRRGCPGQYEVPPGDVMLAWQRISGDASWQKGELHVESNDADEPKLAVGSEANRPAAKIGDLAEDFSLRSTTGEIVKLSSFRKKVVLAKLYNPL